MNLSFYCEEKENEINKNENYEKYFEFKNNLNNLSLPSINTTK